MNQLICLFLLAGIVLGQGSPSLDSLEGRLRVENQRLDNSRTEAGRQKKRHDKILGDLRSRLQKRTRQNQGLQKAVSNLENRVAHLRSQTGSQTGRKKEIALRKTAFLEKVAKQAQLLKEVIRSGLPYDLTERLQRVDFLIRDLREESLSPSLALERLFLVLEEEERAATESAIVKTDIQQNNGERIRGKTLRVGMVFYCYYSEENDAYGIMEKKGNAYKWRESGLNFEERKAIREAFQIKEGKMPPRWTRVPLSIRQKGTPRGGGE